MRNGFSLIELLIVLAIMGILATLSYPTYYDYILRTHRTNGKVALLDLANRMEIHYAKYHTWKNVTIGTGSTTDILENPITADGWYSLSIPHATDIAYTLQATPLHRSDSRCPSLTLTNSGSTKSITNGRILNIS